MSKSTSNNDQFEHLLRAVRLSEPSEELKVRVTDVATNAWKGTSVDISWRVPLRRLAVSAAAAVVIVSLANYVSGRVASGQSRDVHVATREAPELDILPDEVDSFLILRLAATGSRRQESDASRMRDHLEMVRQMLGENQGENQSERDPAVKGRSHRSGADLRCIS